MFNMHSSALYVLGRTWEVTGLSLSEYCSFAGAAFFYWCLDSGLVGYGWAEAMTLGKLMAWFIIRLCDIGSPDYH